MCLTQRWVRAAGTFCAVFCLAASAFAQRDRERSSRNPTDGSSYGSIRGRIVMSNGNFVAEEIKVTLMNARETVSVVYTYNQGQFEFRGLSPGNFILEVEGDRQRYETRTEAVQVYKGTPTVVTIPLKEKESPGVRTASSVSVSELDRSIPAEARKEFEKASKASGEGKTEEVVTHLRRAVSIYPRFVMAYNDLGAQLLAQGKLDEAAEELATAVRLDEKAFNPALNLGIVLVHQHRFAEAAVILGKANSLEANSPSARLYSGLASMGLGNLEAAERDFKAAYAFGGSKFAVAHFHLGQLYLSRGDKEAALNSFQTYLKEVPDAVNGEQVRKTIAMLR